jgi:signal transduction histidine kinase
LDVEPQDIVGVPLREVDIQMKVRDKLLLALSPEHIHEELQSFQVSVEGGRELSVLVSPVRITSQVASGSNMDGWVIVLQDITHIHEAEIARVQFIQAAAHDMKNPLSVTQKSIQLLEEMVSEIDDKMIDEVLGMARSGVGRVQRLIDDLLNIEKIESGYQFKLDDVDVRELLYEISAETQPLMASRDIKYQMNIADNVPMHVVLDGEWIHRALHNYLENAGKYAPDGEVYFSIFSKGNSLHFEVSDTGPGIPLQAQARLFDRFYRVANRSDVSGSGLGLAIVRSVAEAHEGSVYVRSKEGEGSTFGLKLPLS